MAALFFTVLLIGYFLMAAIFAVVAWKSPTRAKWSGLAAIALAAPVFSWLGSFTERFDAGQCYSSTIVKIANAVEHTDAPTGLAKKIRALPLRGYETTCTEVDAAANELPNAKAP